MNDVGAFFMWVDFSKINNLKPEPEWLQLVVVAFSELFPRKTGLGEPCRNTLENC